MEPSKFMLMAAIESESVNVTSGVPQGPALVLDDIVFLSFGRNTQSWLIGPFAEFAKFRDLARPFASPHFR